MAVPVFTLEVAAAALASIPLYPVVWVAAPVQPVPLWEAPSQGATAGAVPVPARTGFLRPGLVAVVCRAMVATGSAWTSCSEAAAAAEVRRKLHFQVRWAWALGAVEALQTTPVVLGVSWAVVAEAGSAAWAGKEGSALAAVVLLLPVRAAVDSVRVGAVVRQMCRALGAVAAALGWAARFLSREIAPL